MAALHVGTSGWSYEHWAGVFYPAGLAAADRLAYYAGRFASVEIDSSFYRLPTAAAVAHWRAAVPAGFVFSVKASRYITHMKRLSDPEATLPPFLHRMAGLGDRLGPLLFQLPPRWRCNPDRLDRFLAALAGRCRAAFELRDPSWWRADVLDCLTRHGAAWCIHDLGGRLSPVVVTADFVYLRLHGPERPYQGSYDDATLAGWAARIRAWAEEGRAVYAYFDNDLAGCAVADAARLQRLLA